MRIPVQILAAGQGLALPRYQTPGAAAMDLYAAHDAVLAADASAVGSTGLALAIPHGFEGQIRGRSGLARQHIFVHTGTIDSDYRGPVGVLMFNCNRHVHHVRRGDRIAQLLIAPVMMNVVLDVVDTLPPAERLGGWGSTGSRD